MNLPLQIGIIRRLLLSFSFDGFFSGVSLDDLYSCSSFEVYLHARRSEALSTWPFSRTTCAPSTGTTGGSYFVHLSLAVARFTLEGSVGFPFGLGCTCGARVFFPARSSECLMLDQQLSVGAVVPSTAKEIVSSTEIQTWKRLKEMPPGGLRLCVYFFFFFFWDFVGLDHEPSGT